MKDPFPIPPPAPLMRLVQPLAEFLSLPTLGLHAHEVIFAFVLYSFICGVVSPALSSRLCPQTYNNLNRRTRLNWNVHVVSLFQSVLVSAMSLWIMFYDEERKELRPRKNWEARVWEYTGSGGLLQSFGLGYFLWDLIMCTWHIQIYGWGMLAHAVSAASVFALGYRPFVYFYAPVFLLYELSSPFLNIHWFCDKLELTGSGYQAVNGAFLTISFLGCRLIWGNLNSIYVFSDIFRAVFRDGLGLSQDDTGQTKNWSVPELMDIYNDKDMQRLAFRGVQDVPLWLALVYLASNLTLNSLNIFWFGKMVATIRKRFDPPLGTKGLGPDKVHYEPHEKTVPVAAAAAAQLADSSPSDRIGSSNESRQPNGTDDQHTYDANEDTHMQSVLYVNGSKSVEMSGQKTVRTRRKA